MGGCRFFGVEIVDDDSDLATMDVLAVLVECGTNAACRLSVLHPLLTPASGILQRTSDVGVMLGAFSMFGHEGTLTRTASSCHHLAALACRMGRGETISLAILFLLCAAIDARADAAKDAIGRTTVLIAPRTADFGVFAEILATLAFLLAKVEVLLAHRLAVHAWTRAILTHFLLHAPDAARLYFHVARLLFPPQPSILGCS